MIKITQEQAGLIEDMKKSSDFKKIVFNAVQNGWGTYFANSEYDGIDIIIRALYIGYEVIPQYKEGDWVTNIRTKRVYKLTKDNVQEVNDENVNRYYIPSTTEEIEDEKRSIWWTKHDRVSLQLKKGDVLIRDNGIEIIEEVYYNGECRMNNGKQIHPDSWYFYYEVVCFVEDRLDEQ